MTPATGPGGPPRGPLWFRLLLRLYPRPFRDEHGAEMAELVRVRLARARGPWARSRVRAGVVADSLTNAWELRARRTDASTTTNGRTTMSMLIHDLRDTVRHLARSPGFTLAAVLLLAVGLGANLTVFGVVDALLFQPPPWQEPERVVAVYQDSDEGEPSSSSFPAVRDMATSDVFRSVAGFSPGFSVIWDGPDGPVEPATEYVTASYLEVMGLQPLRGRWFGPEHDRVGGERVAVVSEPAWRTRFGSDPGIVGRTLRLNGQPVTVIGVGPEGVTGSYPPQVTDFWLSISTTPVSGAFRVANLDRRQDHWYDVRARLADGVSVEQAQAAMDALAARLAAEYPEFNDGRDITVYSARDVRVHPTADGDLYLLGGLLGAVVLTVLLLACANLANLLLVRGLGRSGEMAVRRAMGAGRGRVARLFLLESLVLAVLGGLAGMAVAWWALGVLPRLPIPMPGWASMELGVDARLWAAAGILVALTGLLFGLVPAVRSARADVSHTLRDDGRTSLGGRGTRRLRGALVTVQVATSLVLVVAAGMVGRSVATLGSVDPGVDADRIVWVQPDLSRLELEDGEARVLLDELVEAVAALPGVDGVATTSRLPAQGGGSTTTVVEGYEPPGGTEAVELDFATVDRAYLETMGIPLLAGRAFGDQDVPGAPTGLLLNETGARRFWGSPEAAVGRRMRSQGGETWRTVVGVVGDVPVASLADAQEPMIYFSAEQGGVPTRPYLLARTSGEPATLLAPMRRAVTGVRGAVTLRAQGTVAEQIGRSLAGPRTAATLMAGFSLLAVLLAGLGIYAVVSFTVARRTGELGLRMALGAGRRRVVRLVVGEIAGVVLLGAGVGLATAWLVAGRVRSVLYGVDGLDAVTLVGAVLFLGGVAAVAAWVPARRAARADPVEALRV